MCPNFSSELLNDALRDIESEPNPFFILVVWLTEIAKYFKQALLPFFRDTHATVFYLNPQVLFFIFLCHQLNLYIDRSSLGCKLEGITVVWQNNLLEPHFVTEYQEALRKVYEAFRHLQLQAFFFVCKDF